MFILKVILIKLFSLNILFTVVRFWKDKVLAIKSLPL